MGCPDSELSVVLTGDDEIAGLNEEYLGRQGPTNVIAFPMMEGAFGDVNPGLLGDVVLSVETVDREAADLGYTMEEMLDFYLVHGILHLVGYDHEGSAEEAARMEEKNIELWKILGNRGID